MKAGDEIITLTKACPIKHGLRGTIARLSGPNGIHYIHTKGRTLFLAREEFRLLTALELLAEAAE